jgi:hypothetical protein
LRPAIVVMQGLLPRLGKGCNRDFPLLGNL